MCRERLVKKERLTSSEVRKLFQNGERLRGKSLTLIFEKQDAESATSFNKIAVVASKKVFREAVKRNHIKRLLKEVYRKNKSLFPKTYHYLLLQHRAPEETTYPFLFEEVEKLIKKLPRSKKG